MMTILFGLQKSLAK